MGRRNRLPRVTAKAPMTKSRGSLGHRGVPKPWGPRACPRGKAVSPGASTGDRGSVSVELVVLAPVLALLLLLLGAGGRVVEVQGHIDGAARDAARAASLARSSIQASELARQAALADLTPTSWCAPRSVAVLVTGYPAAGPLPVGGADVAVTVSCEVNMSPFTALGFTAQMRFTGQAVAPLDPFMCRDVTC
jgi:Flp pilus assembly protein TadG